MSEGTLKPGSRLIDQKGQLVGVIVEVRTEIIIKVRSPEDGTFETTPELMANRGFTVQTEQPNQQS